ncbi:MAG: hypothetical protein ACR2IF_04805 [Terriglobales bacterium]
MPCRELLDLRKQATQLKNQVNDQRKKARDKAVHFRHGRPSGKSEFVPFLQRKLARVSARIEQHMADHKCQD